MMNKFILQNIIRPFKGQWLRGMWLLLVWTLAFIALPAISGWFLAMCSVAFAAANKAFSYLVPSAIIRLLALGRTATRYFEKLQNHRTTLSVQQKLQLRIFTSVAKFPYFQKQAGNNSALLENSTQGIDAVLNHVILWVLPFFSLLFSVLMGAVFLAVFSGIVAVGFLASSAVLLFVVPQWFFVRNRLLYGQLKIYREESQHALIQSFRGRIEISKYNLETKAVEQYNERMSAIEKTERKLQTNSFNLQLVVGLGFSFVAAFIFWLSGLQGISVQTAIGIFFGIMAQAELAEMLFSGKSERNAVVRQIGDINAIFEQGDNLETSTPVEIDLKHAEILQLGAHVPQTTIRTAEVSLRISKGAWIALYGETGKGKTTFLNSLFYPEYRRCGTLRWNDGEISNLAPPRCIYVTQKAYLLTGTLRENFQEYADEAIERVLQLVDLSAWRASLPDGLDTWIGENGEMLSGGQRKKLLLAQALLKKPELLVVDEPTAGISTENAIAIFRTIRRHYPDMAILMATHLRDFADVVDEVVEM